MISIGRNQEQQALTSQAYINLIKDSRFLMSQLAYLSREYFVAVFSGFGNAEAIAGHLYQLPLQFQEKAELIFGTPLSEEFMNLLSMHVTYIRALAEALNRGDQAAANFSTQHLYQNAANISAAYMKINPFWNEIKWRTLLYNYINLLIQDAVALASRDFEKDMDISERLLLSALFMGDYHADGFLEYILAMGRAAAL